jgi:signal transduction histidine kinase
MLDVATARRVGSSPTADRLLFAGFAGAALAEELVRVDGAISLRATAWTVALCCPLLVRRSHPLAGTLVATVLVVALPGLPGSPPGLILFALPVVLAYSCGAHGEPLGGLLAVLALSVAIQLRMGLADAPNLEILIGTLPPWWGGSEVRRRRLLVRQLADRTRELEAEEEAFVRLSVERERARIARDLHDIVSHHLALMVVQAGAGRLAEPWEPTLAAGRFVAIREAGVEALAEADRLVTMLDPTSGGPRLAQLFDRAREVGARIVLMPPDLALAPETEAVAHYVAREALTNAMKHAPSAALEIRLEQSRDGLTITTHNDAATTDSLLAGTGSNLGLAGMRARVEALGGEFEAGPDEDGGFALCARLPLQAPSELAAAS